MKIFILISLVGLVVGQDYCLPDEFRCNDGGDCMSQERLCDGTVDCVGGEDESSSACSCDGFRCPYPEFVCVPPEKICDGIADCKAAEEEQECGCWFCDTGECFSEEDVCDGYIDCPGGEDEKDCKSYHPLGKRISTKIRTTKKHASHQAKKQRLIRSNRGSRHSLSFLLNKSKKH